MASILKVDEIKHTSGKALVNSTGSILQVVQETLNTTSGTTSGTSSFATYITKAITPSSSSSKILIIATVNAYAQVGTSWDGPQHNSRLLRGTTHIAGNNFYYQRDNVSSTKFHATDHNISYLDSPSSTSEVTYNLQSKYSNGSSITLYNGFLTLIEVAA